MIIIVEQLLYYKIDENIDYRCKIPPLNFHYFNKLIRVNNKDSLRFVQITHNPILLLI